MTNATLLHDDTRTAVRLERRLADPPEAVWRALTEREQLRTWFPTDVVVDGGEWSVGATISFPFPPEEATDIQFSGEVLEVDEPNALGFTWGDDSNLRFQLSPDGDGTRLVLIDELPPEGAARKAAGWDRCLDRLAGLEPDADGWQPLFEHYTAAFEPALGPQLGPPDLHGSNSGTEAE